MFLPGALLGQMFPEKFEKWCRDPAYYSGRGGTRYEPDNRPEAYKKAKEEARRDLATSIEVTIQAITEDILQVNQNRLTTSQREEFQSITRSYVDKGLQDVEEFDTYINEPARELWVFLRIEKEKYRETAKKELEEKKKSIEGDYRQAAARLATGDLTTGVIGMVKALTKLNESFSGLPVMGDLDGDSLTTEEYRSVIESVLMSKLSSMQISSLKEEYVYSSGGKLAERLVFSVTAAQGGVVLPVRNMPIRVEFFQGEGRIQESAKTDQKGVAETLVYQIDPSYRKVVISARPDPLSVVQGLESVVSDAVLPETQVALVKRSSVVLSVRFNNCGSTQKPSSLTESIKGILMGKSVDVSEWSVRPSPSQDVMEMLRIQGHDLLVIVNLRASAGGKANNIRSATVSGNVSLFSLEEGTLINTLNLPSRKGFGLSSREAGWKALGDLKGSILKTLKSLNIKPGS